MAKTVSELAALGGDARARKLSKEQRKQIARNAAAARWGTSPLPRATHAGELVFGSLTIPCAVLENGTRVISGRGVTRAIGMKGRGQGVTRIVTHKRLNPFMTNELVQAIQNPLVFDSGAPLPTQGYQADVLVELCEAILKARDAGALHTEQEHRYARACEILVRAFAHVGIIALVDEATGFQDERPRDALAKILEAFVAKELRKWVHTFPPEFYKQMFRLRGLPYDGSVKRPGYIGHLTNDIVYARLAPGVLKELREKNPVVDGRRRHKHFQWLTEDIGHPKLQEHLVKVTTLMQVSDTWSGFKVLLDKGFQKYSKLPLFRDIQDGSEAPAED